MKKIKYKNYTILISKSDFKRFKTEVKTVYVNKSRGKPYVSLLLFSGKWTTGAQFVLGNSGHRTFFKDGNQLNLNRSNLVVTNEEHQTWALKRWREKNRKQLSSQSLKRYYQDKEKHKVSAQKYENSEKGKAARLKRRTKLETRYSRNKQTCSEYRGKKFTLSFKQYKILMSKDCYYCDKDLSQETGIGLDRIDNRFGYVKGNVLPCCGECNMIRGRQLTIKETRIAAQAIKQYRESK